MFDLLTVQSLAEERIKDALREAEKARLIRQIRQRRELQGWWAAAASSLKRPPSRGASDKRLSPGWMSLN